MSPDDSESDSQSMFAIIGTGISLGVVHVLTGEKVEFSQGVARVMDSIVGFFMLGLGLYGAYTALQFQDDNVRASELLGSRGSRGSQSQNEVYNFEDVNEIELSELNNNNSDSSSDVEASGDEAISSSQVARPSASVVDNECQEHSHSHDNHDHGVEAVLSCCDKFICRGKGCNVRTNPFLGKLMAFVVGVVHGIAGPGGILGVIPAVHLGGFAACVYLFFFCLTSVLVMAGFAAGYGELSSSCSSSAKLKLYTNFVSSSFSILIGIIWLVLTFMGKLDQYFE
ncbi:hypothetical protein TrRE_jg7399 [Triparma retinervis]|uniref:Uncharacterized protein n=1 Tax=Triparma retinervis TaxID=2557542 RepID=A0A9W6ZJV6_9STRA|nr:hypothetical protein TrRE_jg7399 [Triparma retinervis]